MIDKFELLFYRCINCKIVRLTVNSEEKFEYWLAKSQYDLKAADSMFKSGLWLYVAFMCQQSIEKICKGLYTIFINDDVPRIHNLNALIASFKHKIPANLAKEHEMLLNDLSEYYIE